MNNWVSFLVPECLCNHHNSGCLHCVAVYFKTLDSVVHQRFIRDVIIPVT